MLWDIILIPVPLMLLTMLATYLMPSLTYMLHSLPFPPRVMSLTFLSFANAAPDLITCFTALRRGTAKGTTMGVGELLGSATFGICVVFGTICIMADGSTGDNCDTTDGSRKRSHKGLRVIGRKWTWDIFSLLIVTIFIGYIISDGTITLTDSIILVITYFLFISVWIWRSNHSGLFIDINYGEAFMGENVTDLNAIHDPVLDEELQVIQPQPQESLATVSTEGERPHTPLSLSSRMESHGANLSASPPLLAQNPNMISAASLSTSSSASSMVSQSSDIGELFFHSNINNLERGNSWRLPLIDSVRLAILGLKNRGASSSRISRVSSSKRIDIETPLMASNNKLAQIREMDQSSTNLDVPLQRSYLVYSQPPSRVGSVSKDLNLLGSAQKPKKKAPGIAITDTMGLQSTIADESGYEEVLSIAPSKHQEHKVHLNKDLEEGLTIGSSPVEMPPRPHSLSFDISSNKFSMEGEGPEFLGSIHYLTPSLLHRLCPTFMITKTSGVERIYNLIIVPFITLFNIVIPVPIPAELRERDIESFDWEFALTKKLFHFQLFWAPWIFSDFGMLFSDGHNYWPNLTKFVIIPSIILPIFSWSLDYVLTRGEPPVKMPNQINHFESTTESEKDESKRLFPIILSVISFLYVIKLLSCTTSMLVYLITSIADEYHLSESLLAITIISLANSIGDVITAIALTKLNRIDVAVSAVAGGTICYLCGGIGGVSLITLLLGTRADGNSNGEKLTYLSIKVDTQIWFQLAALAFMLIIFLVVVPCRKWIVERWVGALGITIWLAGIIFGWLKDYF